MRFHVLSHGEERAAELRHQHPAGLVEVVEVGVIAIAFIGQGFHATVAQVAAPAAQNGEEHAALALVHDELLHRGIAAFAHIKITVGSQNYAVSPAPASCLAGSEGRGWPGVVSESANS